MNGKSTVMADMTPRTGTLLNTPQRSSNGLETTDTNLRQFFKDRVKEVNSNEDQQTFYRFSTDFSYWLIVTKYQEDTSGCNSIFPLKCMTSSEFAGLDLLAWMSSGLQMIIYFVYMMSLRYSLILILF